MHVQKTHFSVFSFLGQEPQLPKGQGLGLSKPAEVAKIIQEPVIPTEPPPEFEFIADPPSISAFDL